MKKLRKALSLFLATATVSAAALAGAPLTAKAEDADTLSPTWGLTAYTYMNQNKTVISLPSSSPSSDTTLTVDGGSVTVKGYSSATIYSCLTIAVKDGAKVSVQDLTIENGSSDNIPAVDATDSDAGNTLYVGVGSCTLKGGAYQPGIRVEGSNEITIDKVPTATDGDAVLNVSSSWYAAAIGGRGKTNGNGSDCGAVNIKGGTIVAYACQSSGGGAGIGGGNGSGGGGSGGMVNITGGIVTATGGSNGGAGIGGGVSLEGSTGNGGSVTISGGEVTTCGGEYGGAGIGGGGFPNIDGYNHTGGAGGDIKINGGTVYAYGGKGGISGGTWVPHCGGGAGIGGGGGYTGGAGGDIEISGGNVTAQSNYYGTDTTINRTGGAGIGGGGSYQNVSSSGGTVAISGAGTAVSATATATGSDVGAGVGSSGAADGGGTLTVGTASDCPSSLPTVSFGYSGTNVTYSFVNCIIGGSGATAQGIAGTYYAVFYNLNGGTNGSGNSDVYIAGTGAALSAPTKSGYTFGGWYTASDFSGSAVTSIGTAQTGIVTLYAQWLPQDATAPNITTQPTAGTVAVGGSLTLTVGATGTGVLSYQWYANTADSNSGGTPITGATSSDYTPPTGTAGMYYYYCAVTNTDNTATGSKTATATSDVAAVTVNALTNAATPTITTQPTPSSAVTAGASLTLTVSASIGTGTLSYQWYEGAADSNAGGTAISNATASDYTVPTSAAGTVYYYCVVTNTDSTATGNQTATATSDVAAVTVNSRSSGGGSGSTVTPQPVSITGTATTIGGAAVTTATIPLGDLGSSTSTVTATLGAVSVTAPAGVLYSALNGDASLTITQGASSSATQTAVFELVTASGDIPIASLDLNLSAVSADGTVTAVHTLSGDVTVTVTLTKAQVALLGGGIPDIYYYDTSVSPAALTDMHATFDSSTGALTFTTDHFSTYLIAVATTPATYTPGVSYAAHVQRIGWQKFVTDGSQAGTEGRALRMEGVKIKLTGTLPTGASIVYQAHVQRVGWQAAVSDGSLAGTTGKGLRMEALRVTLTGLSGYAVKYRAYVQNKGWLDWVTTANGTDIANAAVAGTTGKGLRMEAVEIEIVKMP